MFRTDFLSSHTYTCTLLHPTNAPFAISERRKLWRPHFITIAIERTRSAFGPGSPVVRGRKLGGHIWYEAKKSYPWAGLVPGRKDTERGGKGRDEDPLCPPPSPLTMMGFTRPFSLSHSRRRGMNPGDHTSSEDPKCIYVRDALFSDSRPTRGWTSSRRRCEEVL